MKKAIVTGANGFVGSNLIPELLKKNYEVTCLIRSTSDVSSIENLPVKLFTINYNSIKVLHKVCEGKDYIFHIAAKVKAKSKNEYFQANVDLTKNIVEAIRGIKVERFVFLSSQAAAGPAKGFEPKNESEKENPISYYGQSKLRAEKYIQKHCSLPWSIIRPSSVFGPYDKDFYDYFKLINKGLALLPGFSKKYLSLIYVEDLCELIVKAAESPKMINQIIFASDGNIYSIEDFIENIEKVMNKNAVKIHIPTFLSYMIALCNEMRKYFYKNQFTLNMQKVKEMKIPFWLCSSVKAFCLLDFTPKYSLKSSLEKTYKWYKDNKWL